MTAEKTEPADTAGRWHRDPVLVFFVLAGLIFAAYRFFAPAEVQPVLLSAASEAVMVSEFEALAGREPSAEERARLIEEHYQREVLFREGLAAELVRSDPSLREAIIEGMQQRVSGELAEPDARDLVNFYADNIERYYSEATISFEQRFFAGRPGDSEAVLAALRRGETPKSDTAWQGKSFPRYGRSMIRGLFGQALLRALESAPENTWMGPYESPDGWHFVRVSERVAASLLPYERVREQVLADYQAAELDRRVREFVDGRRERYPLQREG